MPDHRRSAGAAEVALDEGAGTVAVGRSAGGEPLWTYVYGARRRPFVHPVRTLAGHVLSRDAPHDHPWHHALWFTIKFVNGENFWEEYDRYGVLRHDGVPAVTTTADGVRVAGFLDWIRPDRETVVVREWRSLTHRPVDDRTYALDVEVDLVPAVDVVLDRTPFTTWGGYGGLAFRGRADLHDTRLLLADGSEHDRVLGTPAAWLALHGLVGGADGDAPAGIAVLDAPGNPHHPVPWYASTRADTYGDEGWSNFVNAAFLWDGPREVAAGQALRFEYRVLVFDGRPDTTTIGSQARFPG